MRYDRCCIRRPGKSRDKSTAKAHSRALGSQNSTIVCSGFGAVRGRTRLPDTSPISGMWYLR